jgi:hypothetical protein
MIQTLEQTATELEQLVLSRLAEFGIPGEFRSVHGDPGAELIRIADEVKADAVVVGSKVVWVYVVHDELPDPGQVSGPRLLQLLQAFYRQGGQAGATVRGLYLTGDQSLGGHGLDDARHPAGRNRYGLREVTHPKNASGSSESRMSTT